MSSLFAALQTASHAMRVIEKSIGVVQNNTINATTPGYAVQQLETSALAFNPSAGWYGGLMSGGVIDARNEFAEAGVRNELMQKGFYSARANVLQGIDSAFDVSGTSSLGGAINNLFSAFSAWSQQPNDSTVRQSVINAAEQFVNSMKQTSNDLQQNVAQITQEVSSNVDAVNRLAARISDLNKSNMQNASAAASNSSELYATLEELSEIANFTTLNASDGTTTVLLNGHIPLVVGGNTYPIGLSMVSSGSTNAPPSARILDSSGTDITSSLNEGTLGGLLSVRNGDVATLLGDSTQNGMLNDLAYQMASAVNNLLTSGNIDSSGTPGVPLFTVVNDASAASGIALATTDPAQLAAIDPGPPLVSNGVAMKLAGLATDKTTMPGGMSFVDYYGSMAADVGRSVNTASSAATRQTLLVSNARSLRSEVSGVSLDEEAAKLTELQRSYEATAQVFTIANGLMDTLLNMVRR